MLQELTKDVFVAEGTVRFLGAGLPTRMTVIRLQGGSLFVHSPIELDGVEGDLERTGGVRFIIAPSRYHHVSVGSMARAFPDARVFAAPGLREKRRDLRIDSVLTDDAPGEWSGEMDQLIFRALPIFNEVIFFHRASRTLLTTDLVFHFQEVRNPVLRFGLWLNGTYRRFGPSRLIRRLMRDRSKAREDIARILDWDFYRVIMSHGAILETGGREALRSAFAFL